MATVAEHRSTELQLIYRSSLDRRTLRQESLEALGRHGGGCWRLYCSL